MTTIRVKLRKGVIYDHLMYPADSVLEMLEAKATYLIGTNLAEKVDTPLTPTPRPIIVKPKDQAQATGMALADALKTLLPPAQARYEDQEAEPLAKKKAV